MCWSFGPAFRNGGSRTCALTLLAGVPFVIETVLSQSVSFAMIRYVVLAAIRRTQPLLSALCPLGDALSHNHRLSIHL